MDGELIVRKPSMPQWPDRTSRQLDAVAIPELRKDLGRVKLSGLLLVLVFFGLGGTWAATAHISGAVIANATVSPDGSRKTVQHLEGGIVRSIRVKEGDTVAGGAELAVLEDVAARSDRGVLMNRLISLLAHEERLRTEQRRSTTLAFANPLLADTTNPVVASAIDKERSSFEKRVAIDAVRKSVLKQKVAQLGMQIVGFERQLEGVRKQQELLGRETEIAELMLKKGLERLPRILALQRAQAERIATEGEILASVGRAKEAINEVELQSRQVDAQRAEQVEQELSDVQVQRVQTEDELRKYDDRLARTVVRAPVAGIILNLRIKSPGAVVPPGGALMDIVPTDESLVIEARVSPRDIDDVQIGSSARVTFPSYPQRRVLRIPGSVTRVSADALDDQRTGTSYYTARVEVDRVLLRQLAPSIHLTPGLPAEVYISTGDRTVLDYLLQPLEFSLERTFREK